MASDLETELQCAICLDYYDNPCTLPCQHCFCYSCLCELHKLPPKPGTAIVCPTCRKEFAVPSDSIESIPRNFTLANIVEKYREDSNGSGSSGKASDSSKRSKGVCDLCEGAKKRRAFRVCRQCGVSYCKPCFSTYHPMRGPLASHVVQTPAKASATTASPTCPDHEGKELDMFCVSCKRPICYLCDRVGGHHKHEVCDIMSAFSQRKKNITDRLKKLTESQKQHEIFMKKLQEGSKICKSHYSETEKKVSTHFDRLRHTITSAEEAITKQLEERRKRKLQAINHGMEKNSKASSDIQKVTTDATQVVKEKDPVTFLLNASELECRLQKSEKQKAGSCLPDDLHFSYLCNLDKCMQTASNIRCHSLNLIPPWFANMDQDEPTAEKKLVYDMPEILHPLKQEYYHVQGGVLASQAIQKTYKCVGILATPLTRGHNYIEFRVELGNRNQQAEDDFGTVFPTKRSKMISSLDMAVVLTTQSPLVSGELMKGSSSNQCQFFCLNPKQIRQGTSFLCRLLIKLDSQNGSGVLAVLPSASMSSSDRNHGADVFSIPMLQDTEKKPKESISSPSFYTSSHGRKNTMIYHPPRSCNFMLQKAVGAFEPNPGSYMFRQSPPPPAKTPSLCTPAKQADAPSRVHLGFCLNTPGASIEVVENPQSWEDACKLVF